MGTHQENMQASVAAGTLSNPAGDLPRPWLRSNAIAETMGGRMAGGTSSIVSGTLKLVGSLLLPAQRPISAITFMSAGTALASGTNQWFCLVSKALAVLATTVDDGATAWAANTEKTLQLATAIGGAVPGGTYAPPLGSEVFVGICVVAATPPSLQALTVPVATVGLAPILHGNSTPALTTPASLGANAGALTPVANVPWTYVS